MFSFPAEGMAHHIKDNIKAVIGFNREICCVTDMGTRDGAHIQTEKKNKKTNPCKHTHSETHARRHIIGSLLAIYDPNSL